MQTMRPLLFLELRQIYNLAKLTLRTPKRLGAAILIAFFICQMILSQVLFGASRHRATDGIVHYLGPHIVWVICFAAILTLTIYLIIKSFSENPIIFGLSEMDFIFPAPLNRHIVMSFKLIKLYVRSATYLGFLLFFFLPALGMQIGYWSDAGRSLIGLAGIVSYLVLLLNCCTIVNYITTYREDGKWWLRAAVKWAEWGIVAYLVIGVLVRVNETPNLILCLAQVVQTPVFMALTLPIKWGTDLMLMPFIDWHQSMIFEALGLFVLSLISIVLVLIRHENTYEPSLAGSVRYAAIRSAYRSGGFAKASIERMRGKQGFAKVQGGVPPFGRGAMAILWKNVNLSVRNSGKQYIIFGSLIIIALTVVRNVFSKDINAVMMRTFILAVLGYVVWLIPLSALNTFRSDVMKANILKPIPIPAWQFIAAETIHSTLLITLLSWLVIGTVVLLYGLAGDFWLKLAWLIIPFISHCITSSQMLVGVLYPDWTDQSQRFTGSLLSVLANTLAIVPSAVAGVAVFYLHGSVYLMAIAISIAALCVSTAGILAAAVLYRKNDPTD